MGLDAIVIADIGEESFSSTNPLKLQIEGRIANIDVIDHILRRGTLPDAAGEGGGTMSWSSAPKLNGLHLYDYLTRRNHRVQVINSYYAERETFRTALGNSPRAVIISTTFIHNKKSLARLARDIRSMAPDIFIIAGGPFVLFSHRMLAKLGAAHYEFPLIKDDFLFVGTEDEPEIDLYVVSLDGKRVLAEAMKRIKEARSLEDLPNSARFVRNRYVFGTFVDDVAARSDSLDWKELPDITFASGVVPLEASGGCPYRCAFCNFIRDRRLTFTKPLEQLVEELKAVSQRGARYVWFVDDNFRLGARNLNSVCERLVQEAVPISWMSFIRASALIEVDADLLRRAGCVEVQLGIESADPQVLRNMQKEADPDVYKRVIDRLLAAGINCSCYFIFGFPGETGDSVRRTREFIESIEHPELDGALSWSMFPFTLAPLSPIYEPEARSSYGLTGYMFEWKHASMDAREARKHLLDTFTRLDNSGAIYRGDDLGMLNALGAKQRKAFAAARHRLSKSAIRSPAGLADIERTFKEILSH